MAREERATNLERVRLCGRLAVEADGLDFESSLPGRQGRLLFAYLATERHRAVSRDELIGVLWPHAPPADADAALRTYVSKLRRVLGADTLDGRSAIHLSLPAGVWVDLEAASAGVEAAEAAIAELRYRDALEHAGGARAIAERGFLEGFSSPWVEERRRGVEELRLRALESAARAGLELGDAELFGAEQSARDLIRAAPLRESGYRLLMETQAARGNVAEALTVYEELRSLLREELGGVPGASVTALHERLLREGRAGPASGSRATAAPEAPPLPAALAQVERAPLVGRGAELEALRKAWSATCAGQPRIALVSGEAGIGKTRLAARLAAEAHDAPATVLLGRCEEALLAPYQPIIEALRHFILHTPEERLREQAGNLAELGRLIPAVRRRLPDLPEPQVGDAETERYRLFDAVASLLGDASRDLPGLLVIDDLHRADRPTVLLLRYLLRLGDDARLLVLGTSRPDEMRPGSGLAELVADLRRDGTLDDVAVTSLDEKETAELVVELGGDAPADFARALHDRARGNPFYTREILADLDDRDVERTAASVEETGVPQGVSSLIGRRLDRLGEARSDVLAAASVVGERFALERVELVVDADALEALEAARGAGLVSESPDRPGGYHFVHTLVRESLYEGLPAVVRARLHARLAVALASGAAGAASASELAHHLLEAGEHGDRAMAARFAAAAGDEAREVFAYEEAARWYRRALGVPDSADPAKACELLLRAGEAERKSGERARARETLLHAAELARGLGDPERLARAGLALAAPYVPAGQVDELVVELLEESLTDLPESPLRVRALARLSTERHFSDRRDQLEPMSGEATDLARRLGDGAALAAALVARVGALWSPDRLDERLAVSRELGEVAARAGESDLVMLSHRWQLISLLERGDVDAARAAIERGTQLAAELRQPLYESFAATWRVLEAQLAGRFDDVERLIQEAVEVGLRAERGDTAQVGGAQLAALRLEQGRGEELVSAVEDFVASLPSYTPWRAGLALMYAQVDRLDDARREFEVLSADGFARVPRDGMWLSVMCDLAEVCVALGDRRHAAILYERLESYAARNAARADVACGGSVARWLGMLARTLARWEEGERHFEAALEANAALGPPLLAHARYEYARLLIERGDDGRGGLLLAEALATARELGMRGLEIRGVQHRLRVPR